MSEKTLIRKVRNLSETEVIRPKDLSTVAGISNTTAWRLEKTGDFPKRRKLSPGASGWTRRDIETWLNSRVA
jgi:prophage regulatory protein